MSLIQSAQDALRESGEPVIAAALSDPAALEHRILTGEWPEYASHVAAWRNGQQAVRLLARDTWRDVGPPLMLGEGTHVVSFPLTVNEGAGYVAARVWDAANARRAGLQVTQQRDPVLRSGFCLAGAVRLPQGGTLQVQCRCNERGVEVIPGWSPFNA